MPVDSPRDPVDDWLGTDVTPLNPPPGSLARIRQRARRRKTRQATFAAAGCAVVLAGAVVTPQLISASHQPGHKNPPVAIQSTAPSVQASATHSSHSSAPQAHKATQFKQHTTLTHSWTAPPRNFRPTSVTFAGTGNGGVVGAVIGQAGTPGHCATPDCTSLAGTSTYGASWYGVGAPVAPGPGRSTGVSQLRFANTYDGWAYGPALYETSAGGWPWQPESTGGQRVIDVEAAPAHVVNGVAVPARAFAVFGNCSGTGAHYAATCASFSLWTSVAGSTTWTAVGVPAAYQTMNSASSAAPLLVISGGTTGYLLTPSGEMLSGPVTGGSWQPVGQAPCKPGAPDISGQPAQNPGAQLAAGPELLLTCETPSAGAGSRVVLYTSSDGRTWGSAGNVPAAGPPTSLASGTPPLQALASAQVVLATTAGIEYSANGGRSWQPATFEGGPPTEGFSYVGMTSPTLGVAVPVNPDLREIFTTSDGGKTWQPSPIRT
jgi:hypothetical protein